MYNRVPAVNFFVQYESGELGAYTGFIHDKNETLKMSCYSPINSVNISIFNINSLSHLHSLERLADFLVIP